MNELYQDAITLLQDLIRTESYSGNENGTADIIQQFFSKNGIQTDRLHNNIIAKNKYYNSQLPTIILNSHHDTVKVNNGWTKDPFGATIEGDHLYGRGSNDAGASLVSLIALFRYYYDADLPFNLMLIASGEEENFGSNGVSSVLHTLEFEPSLAIIGEPTEMNMAIAEKGLIVIDAHVKGEAGHAARDIGINALYLATEDIQWIKQHQWHKVSQVLGPVKTTVTQISAGSQHNVIPDACHYVIDCRVNEHYTLSEVVENLDQHTQATLTPRSLRWHPSGIDSRHPIVQKGVALGLKPFGSPTLSDQVHFTCPSIKIGPGMSERSHIADEYILLSEIENGINVYINLLKHLQL
jgi:acetylornithine deacetylase